MSSLLRSAGFCLGHGRGHERLVQRSRFLFHQVLIKTEKKLWSILNSLKRRIELRHIPPPRTRRELPVKLTT